MSNILVSDSESDLKELYEENGYVAIRNAISKTSLDRLRKDLITLVVGAHADYEDFSKVDRKLIQLNETDRPALHKLQIAATKLSSFYAIVSELHEYVAKVNPSEDHIFFKALGFVLGIPGSQRLAYDWHQDGTYHGNNTGEIVTHVWFPVFYPAKKENGTMSFLDRSHKLGLLEFENIKLEKNGYTTHKVAEIDSLVASHDELFCELELGDCLFFCDDIIHKSNMNQTRLCRLAGVMKFTFNISHDVHSGLVGV